MLVCEQPLAGLQASMVQGLPSSQVSDWLSQAPVAELRDLVNFDWMSAWGIGALRDLGQECEQSRRNNSELQQRNRELQQRNEELGKQVGDLERAAQQVSRYRAEAEQARAESRRAREEVKNLKASLSWKLTAPLRRALELLRKLSP